MGKWTVFSPPIVDLCLAEPESAELVAAEDPLYYLEKNVDGFIPTLGAKTRRKGGRLQLAGSPSVHWSAPLGVLALALEEIRQELRELSPGISRWSYSLVGVGMGLGDCQVLRPLVNQHLGKCAHPMLGRPFYWSWMLCIR